MIVDLTEEERQFVLLSLATLSLNRLGFEYFARRISAKLQGEEMFDRFRDSDPSTRTALPKNCLSPLSCQGAEK